MIDYSINKRIKKFIDHLNVTPYEFSKNLGFKRPDNIYNMLNEKVGASKTIIEKVLNKYTNINRIWLLTGEGSMLSQPQPQQLKPKNGNAMKTEELLKLLNLPETPDNFELLLIICQNLTKVNLELTQENKELKQELDKCKKPKNQT